MQISLNPPRRLHLIRIRMPETDAQNTASIPEPAKSALGASLCADYEALKNDLDQAKDLAADFQRQLAGKSNELAHFKAILQRTQEDFNRLEGHIEELRRERHRLANEAMRSTALDAQLLRKQEEIDRLRDQIETLRSASSNRVEELLIVSEDQQREIQRLRAIVEVLRRREGVPPILTAGEDSEMQRQITDLKATVKRLQTQLSQTAFTSTGGEGGAEQFDADVINLTFER